MARVIDCRVEPSSVVDVFPLSVRQEGGEYLVGRQGARSYLALAPIAFEAIALLGDRVPVGRVKEQLAAKYDLDNVTVAPLLEQLLSAGLVRAIDGQPIERDCHPDASRRRLLTSRHVAPLFGKPALVTYALILAGGFASLFDPRSLPRLDLILADRTFGMALLFMCLLGANAVKHEGAHIAAGRFLGVDARCRLSYRLFFPVVETDLSGLWMVEPRKRYLAYGAGVVSDLLAGSLASMVIWAHVHGWVALNATVYRALELTVLIVALVVTWQCNVFLRTDGYYALANTLGCRNLAGDARAYLRTRSSSYPRAVRIYAIGYAVTVAVLCVLWVVGLSVVLRAGAQHPLGARAFLAVSVVLLFFGIVADRRRSTVYHRLIYPAGLLLLLAVSAPGPSCRETPGLSYRSVAALDVAHSSLHGLAALFA